MSEWWTYRPSDFLMFAPRTYWRLFELHNEAWWPLQPLLVLCGLGWLVWAWRDGRAGAAPARPAAVRGVSAAAAAKPFYLPLNSTSMRAGAAGLASAWAFVALAFVLPRYAPINAAAPTFAAAFVALSLTLVALATRPDLHAVPRGLRRHVGALLTGWSLVGHPGLAAAFGRPWLQGESFGMTPDPTAIATLGFLLLCTGGERAVTRVLRRVLWLLTITWCVVTIATLWTMGSAQAWVVAAAAIVAWVTPMSGRRRLLLRP